MTSERMPALASRCGNGNGESAMSGSYTSWPRTQRDRPFSSMGTTVLSLMSSAVATRFAARCRRS